MNAMNLRFKNELGLERLPGLVSGIAKELALSRGAREDITYFLSNKCLDIVLDYMEIFDDPTRRTPDTLVLVVRLRYGDLRDSLALAATQFAFGKVA